MSLCEQTLQKLEKVMRERLPVILNKYLDEVSSLVLIIAGDRDVNNKRKAAHDVKSASASVGAVKLSKLAKQLEMDESLSKAEISTLASEIGSEFEAVKHALIERYALPIESGIGAQY